MYSAIHTGTVIDYVSVFCTLVGVVRTVLCVSIAPSSCRQNYNSLQAEVGSARHYNSNSWFQRRDSTAQEPEIQRLGMDVAACTNAVIASKI